MKYLIWSYDYDHASAGPKALHRLCHELRLRGIEAYVSGAPNPEWDTPQSGPLSGDWTAVYPEIVSGNPWNAPHVARWVLNVPGLLGGDTTYASSETVFSWSPLFSDAPMLYLPTVELDIYTDRGEHREGAAVYTGKGIQTQAILGAEYVTLEMRRDRHALADLLNRVGVLYSFDPVSGMNDVARLCGCPVVLISEGPRPGIGMDWSGIGWGYVPRPFDVAAFRARYLDQIAAVPDQIARFISLTDVARITWSHDPESVTA